MFSLFLLWLPIPDFLKMSDKLKARFSRFFKTAKIDKSVICQQKH